jgi:hypothetical protein
VWLHTWDPQFSHVVARACKIRVHVMSSSRKEYHRWIMATIVESGNRQFWGWTNCALWRFFRFYFFSVRGTKTFFFAFGRENSPVQPLTTVHFERYLLVRISYPKTDPLLSLSMRQASFKCETPRLELKSSRSFLAIKRFQWTESKKVFNRSQSSLKSWAHICAHRG